MHLSTISQPDVDNLLAIYRDKVAKASKILNLVSRQDVKNLLDRLIDESLQLLSWDICRLVSPLIDIGTGAGIPGIPLRIKKPGLAVVLLESNRRKSLFLRKTIDELKLDDVKVVCNRAENIICDSAFTGRFNTLVSRAAAPMSSLLLWGERLLRPGGELIAWKGSSLDSELKKADLTGWDEVKIWEHASTVTLVRTVKL